MNKGDVILADLTGDKHYVKAYIINVASVSNGFETKVGYQVRYLESSTHCKKGEVGLVYEKYARELTDGLDALRDMAQDFLNYSMLKNDVEVTEDYHKALGEVMGLIEKNFDIKD